MSLFSRPFFAPLAGLVVSLSVFLAGEAGCWVETRRAVQDEHNQVTTLLGQYRADLEGELNAALYLTNGLIAYVVTHETLEPQAIQSVLKVLHEQGPHVRNIAVAPGNRVTHIYPLAGNEKALGLHYPDVPDQWPAVQRAIAQRQPNLAGPVQLRQGGIGLIYRVPVFERSSARYWGLVSMVINMEGLFQQVGIAPRAGSLEMALRGKDGTGSSGSVFMGSARLFDEDVVTSIVSTPGGSWQLAARPIDGWAAKARVGWIRASAWTLGLLLGLSVHLAFAGVGRRLRTEKALRDSEALLREQKGTLSAILENSGVGIAQVRDRKMLWCNPRMGELFGHSLSEMEHHSTRMLYTSDAAYEAFGERAYRALSDERRFVSEQEMQHRNGQTIWMRISGQAVNADDATSGSIWIYEDISDQKKAEADLFRLATTDSLTGVANRHRFFDQFRAEMARTQRFGKVAALLMLDLDHFKKVNDTHGHAMGDTVLRHFAGLALKHTRSIDIVGRLGGEEFAIILSETGLEGAQQFAARFCQRVEESEVPGPLGTIKYTVSIGIATFDAHSTHSDLILGQADEALYQAKEGGRNTFRTFDAGACAPVKAPIGATPPPPATPPNPMPASPHTATEAADSRR